MKPDLRRSIGRLGEISAADYLEKNGYSIYARNWRSPYGEVDLIAIQDGAFVFVEVKTRSSTSLGPPEISITPRKAQHMREAAECYFQLHPEVTADWRIDLITVQLTGGNNSPVIDHFENAIQ